MGSFKQSTSQDEVRGRLRTGDPPGKRRSRERQTPNDLSGTSPVPAAGLDNGFCGTKKRRPVIRSSLCHWPGAFLRPSKRGRRHNPISLPDLRLFAGWLQSDRERRGDQYPGYAIGPAGSWFTVEENCSSAIRYQPIVTTILPMTLLSCNLAIASAARARGMVSVMIGAISFCS